MEGGQGITEEETFCMGDEAEKHKTKTLVFILNIKLELVSTCSIVSVFTETIQDHVGDITHGSWSRATGIDLRNQMEKTEFILFSLVITQ